MQKKRKKKLGGYAGRYFLQVLWCVMTFWGITFVYWQTLTVQHNTKQSKDMFVSDDLSLLSFATHGILFPAVLHFSVSVSPSPLLIATAYSFTCPLPENMSTINNSLHVTTEHPVQLTKTLMYWYMVQGWKSVIYRLDGVSVKQLSWCLSKLSSMICIVWYVIVLTGLVTCLYRARARSSGGRQSKSLGSCHQSVTGLCCPVLSDVSVCYYSQWWTLTDLCSNGECFHYWWNWLFGLTEPHKRRQTCRKQTHLIIFYSPE